jgi:hypothetical protein
LPNALLAGFGFQEGIDSVVYNAQLMRNHVAMMLVRYIHPKTDTLNERNKEKYENKCFLFAEEGRLSLTL